MKRFAVLLAPLLVLATMSQPAQARPRLLYDIDVHVKKVVDLGVEKPILGLTALSAQLAALKELHRCFNCAFPVKGAPKAFPQNGQYIPLKACAFPGACRNAPVKMYYHPERLGFLFVAQPGHFDGAGSVVEFRFFRNDAKELMLRVTGVVTNPSVPDVLNRRAAHDMWNMFGYRMGYDLYWYQHCRFIC